MTYTAEDPSKNKAVGTFAIMVTGILIIIIVVYNDIQGFISRLFQIVHDKGNMLSKTQPQGLAHVNDFISLV